MEFYQVELIIIIIIIIIIIAYERAIIHY